MRVGGGSDESIEYMAGRMLYKGVAVVAHDDPKAGGEEREARRRGGGDEEDGGAQPAERPSGVGVEDASMIWASVSASTSPCHLRAIKRHEKECSAECSQ
jgi:hypothetical protein